jgi:hypothetical protein
MRNFCKKKIPHVWKKMQLHIPDSCLKLVWSVCHGVTTLQVHEWNPSVDCRVARVFFSQGLVMDGWCPFVNAQGRKLLEKHWRELTPRGVKDLSFKWIKMFTTVSWLEAV